MRIGLENAGEALPPKIRWLFRAVWDANQRLFEKRKRWPGLQNNPILAYKYSSRSNACKQRRKHQGIKLSQKPWRQRIQNFETFFCCCCCMLFRFVCHHAVKQVRTECLYFIDNHITCIWPILWYFFSVSSDGVYVFSDGSAMMHNFLVFILVNHLNPFKCLTYVHWNV